MLGSLFLFLRIRKSAQTKVSFAMSMVLIKNGSVVTMDDNVRNLDRGDILIDGDKIAEIGENIQAPPGTEQFDATDMIVMPGLVNAHIHTWQTGLRGIAGDWTAKNYFRAMHAGLATFFQPEDIYIANLVGALNQINSGVTTLVDWHHNNPTPAHSDAAIDGLEGAGIRALFLHGSPKPDAKPGQKPYSETPMPRGEVERLRRGRFSGNDGLLSLGMAILGPQMSIHDVVMQDFRLARELDIVTSLHHSGADMPAPEGYDRAAEEGLIGDNINIVHGNALSDHHLKLLFDHGATFAVTAEVEMQMVYGDPLTGRLRALGAPIPVGTDVECAYGPDMFAVMRTTLQLERHLHGMREVQKSGTAPYPMPITTQEALRWATMDGARMARLDSVTGSLTPGKQADITLLRKNDLNLSGVTNPINAIVLHANPGNVDTVFVAGKALKRHGEIQYDGLGEKLAQLKKSAARILKDFQAKSPTASFL